MNKNRLHHRIPVSVETRNRLRDFSYGGGAIYDDVLNFLLDAVRQDGEDDYMAARRLRPAIAAYLARRAGGEEQAAEAAAAGAR